MEGLSKREGRQLRMDAFISRHPFLEFLYCRVFLGYFNGDLVQAFLALLLLPLLVTLVALLWQMLL